MDREFYEAIYRVCFKAAFTPAQHVARQKVARTSNMLLVSRQHNIIPNILFRATSNLLVARNMLRWCKRGLTAQPDVASIRVIDGAGAIEDRLMWTWFMLSWPTRSLSIQRFPPDYSSYSSVNWF